MKCNVDLVISCVTMRSDIAEKLGFSFHETETQPVGKSLGFRTANLSRDTVDPKVKIHVVLSDCQKVGHPYKEQRHFQILSRMNELNIKYSDYNLPTSRSGVSKTLM